ncbi:MAG: DUF2721 domain-containing protein [Pseudomonadota bacterium]|nr:DUF2721 domain-containing protein [Pseudomonadota bacterium]MED5502275.1 DUF2721 domain-containing protein [Pseudomonadota bacterium]|tara:strand:+ start:124 stop:522 length:399 start_codon:yes stop_codon:yes gene_type:complete
MEDLNFWYPALLFPAIPLMMIVFGNRYSSLSKLIRELHDRVIQEDEVRVKFTEQIELLTDRLFLVKSMQTLAGLSFIANLLTIFFRYINIPSVAFSFFGVATILLSASILLFVVEIQKSSSALSKHISDLKK